MSEQKNQSMHWVMQWWMSLILNKSRMTYKKIYITVIVLFLWHLVGVFIETAVTFPLWGEKATISANK